MSIIKHHIKGLVWANTGIKCPICGGIIYRECTETGLSPYDHFCCNSIGCTFLHHPMNQYALTVWDFHPSIERCTNKIQILYNYNKIKAYSNLITNSIHIELPWPKKFKVINSNECWVRGADFSPVKLKKGEFKRI